MLDELADAEDLPRGAELLLDGVERIDGRLGTVGAVEVPRVETGEVLHGSEHLVAPGWGCWLVDCGSWLGGRRIGRVVGSRFQDSLSGSLSSGLRERTGRRDKAEVMGHRRMVD